MILQTRGVSLRVCCVPLRNRDSWCPRDKHPAPKGPVGPTHSAALDKHLGGEKHAGTPRFPVEARCPECGQGGPFHPEFPRLCRRKSEMFMLMVMFRERLPLPEERETTGFISGYRAGSAGFRRPSSRPPPPACLGTWVERESSAVTARVIGSCLQHHRLRSPGRQNSSWACLVFLRGTADLQAA